MRIRHSIYLLTINQLIIGSPHAGHDFPACRVTAIVQ
jgi:hypothetical protein